MIAGRCRAAEANAEDPEAFADVYVMLFEGALVLRQVYGRNDAARSALPAIEKLIGKPIPRLQLDGDDPPAEQKSETGERPAAAKNGRSRRSGRNRRDRQRNVQPASAKPAEPVTEPAPRPAPKIDPPDEPVLGLGDHVPAFLMRESKPAKKKTAKSPRKRPSA